MLVRQHHLSLAAVFSVNVPHRAKIVKIDFFHPETRAEQMARPRAEMIERTVIGDGGNPLTRPRWTEGMPFVNAIPPYTAPFAAATCFGTNRGCFRGVKRHGRLANNSWRAESLLLVNQQESNQGVVRHP
jgi:hypothetical protein